MRGIFDELNDVYAKYYSSSEHLAVDKVVVLSKVGLFSNSMYH
jgi:hypothetical protein